MSFTTVDYLYFIAEKYAFYAGIVNLIIGLIGNLLLILIFFKVKIFRRNQCSFYLIIESCSDILLISSMYISRIVTAIIGIDPISISIVWCKLRSMIVQSCGFFSVLTISCMTIDQFFSTHYSTFLRQFGSYRLAYRLTIINLCFTILHSSLFLIFNDIQSMICTVYNSIIRKYLSFFYYPILSNTIPTIITITFSLLAYRNVHRIIRRQISIVRRRLDRQLTSMVLARVILIIICGLPYVCTTLYGFNVDKSGDQHMQLAILSLATVIADTMLITNFCVNFLFGKNFFFIYILGKLLSVFAGFIAFSSAS